MRKIILSMMVSLDGYIEARNPEEEWFIFDEEMAAYFLNFFTELDTFIYGRKAYESMLGYWPEAKGQFADIMNSTPKLVLSRTLKKAEWNATVLSGNIKEEVQKIKGSPGKNIALFAGAETACLFLKLGLIDELRLIVNPIILGAGKSLFQGFDEKIYLRLLQTRPFACGNVILYYEPTKKTA